MPLRRAGAIPPLAPGDLDVLGRDPGDRGRRDRRAEARIGLCLFVFSHRPLRRERARERHRLLERRKAERDALSLRCQTDRVVEQACARRPVERPPFALARHLHEVGVQREEVLARPRDRRLDLDFDPKERGEVRVGLEERRVKVRRPDEHDTHANRHRDRAKGRRVEAERPERVLGADLALPKDPLHSLPDDRIGEKVRRANDQHAPRRAVEDARANPGEIGEERAEAGAALHVAEQVRVGRVRLVEDGRRGFRLVRDEQVHVEATEPGRVLGVDVPGGIVVFLLIALPQEEILPVFLQRRRRSLQVRDDVRPVRRKRIDERLHRRVD